MRNRRLWAGVVGVVGVGLPLSGVLPLPTPVLELPVPGTLTLLNIELAPARLVGAAAAILVCALLELLLRADSRLAGAGLARTAPHWVLPGLTVCASFELYGRLSAPAAQGLVLILGVGLVSLIAWGQLHSLAPSDHGFNSARLALNALAYGLGLALFLAALSLPARRLLAPPLIALGSAGLSLELLRSLRTGLRALWGRALLVGLVMGELAWALTWGGLSHLAGACLLLAVFYLTAGLLQERLWGRYSRRIALEYLAVTVLCVGAVLWLGR